MPMSARKRFHHEHVGGAFTNSAQLVDPSVRRVKAAPPHATIGATLERILWRSRNSSSRSPKKGGAPHSSTRRATGASLTDESLQHTNNTRSLRRTISSVSLHNSCIMNVRGPKKRITLEGQRRNTEQKVNTGISMAKHGTSGDATLKLEPEKEKGKPVDAVLEKRKTRDQSENTVLFKELGNTIGEPQTGDVAEASSTASLAVASLKPSVHTTPGNKGSMDDHTKVPSHQVKQTLDSPESKLSQSIAKGGGRGINISDDLDLEFDLLSHTRDVTYSPQDVNLVIRAPETAITIWDGRVELVSS